MFFIQMKKEIKCFFSSKGNLLFMFAMPILLITVFSFALKDYISAEYNTFSEGKVYYYVEDKGFKESENNSDNVSNKVVEFEQISKEISQKLGVRFEEVFDYQNAKAGVESSKAYGLITIKKEGYDYFRSSFNEPEGGKLVRSLFVQLANSEKIEQGLDVIANEEAIVNKTRISINKLDSKNYYTFVGLAFSILFMGLLVAFMVYDEKEYGTIRRIKLGGSGISTMVISKALTGLLCGAVMIGASYLYTTIVLKVNWGDKKLYIIAVLLCLVLFSAVFGCLIGLIGKNKSMCQSSVLMFSMLCGYLGGSITPLYLLEAMPVLKWIIRISPLYYTNRAIISLFNGIVDEKTYLSIGVLLGLVVFFIILSVKAGRKEAQKA